MENKLLDKVSRALSVEMPYAESMDRYLDQIIKEIRPLGEDLREEEYYVEKPWLEIRDDVNFHQTILHFFNDGGEYLRSIDGDVSGGAWRYLERSNKLLIELGNGAELYDLAFLDGQFFILDKHGDQERLGQRKYTVLVIEPLGKRMEWRDAMEYLYSSSRNKSTVYIIIVLIMLTLIAIMVTLSFW